MQGPSQREIRYGFVGSWTAIAVLGELLIDKKIIGRNEILEALSATEAVRGDESETPLREIRFLIEQLGAACGD